MYNQLSAATQRFGADVLNKILASDKNVCISPLSIAMCFAMLTEGADGSTKDQIMNTFHYPSEYLAGFKQVARCAKSSTSRISIANSIWMKDTIEFNENYLEKAKKNFKKAKLSKLDFSDAKSVKKINAWVKEKTEGKIEEIIQALSADTLLVLVNAIYFDAKWENRFDAEDTSTRNFHLLDQGKSCLARMMQQEAKFNYTRQDSFSAVALPYEGKESSMIIILPHKNTKQELDRVCSQQFLDTFMANRTAWMKSTLVDLILPKFTFESEHNLIPLLRSLGLTQLFAPGADLSKLTKTKEAAFVDQAVHKTFIEVDEEGTKAAAVTAAVCVLESAVHRRGEKFHADHPFVFMIFHHTTEQILFLGRVTDPTGGKTKESKKRNADHIDSEDSDAERGNNKRQKVSIQEIM